MPVTCPSTHQWSLCARFMYSKRFLSSKRHSMPSHHVAPLSDADLPSPNHIIPVRLMFRQRLSSRTKSTTIRHTWYAATGRTKSRRSAMHNMISEQDSGDVADEESDSSYVSTEDSLSIQIEVDSSWLTSASKTPDILRSDEDTEEEGEGVEGHSSAASRLKSRSVQSYHDFEHAQHISSRMRT